MQQLKLAAQLVVHLVGSLFFVKIKIHGGGDSFQFSATKTKANEPAFGIAIISVFVYPNQRSSCFNSMWSTCD